jgi:hypothetical protein
LMLTTSINNIQETTPPPETAAASSNIGIIVGASAGVVVVVIIVAVVFMSLGSKKVKAASKQPSQRSRVVRGLMNLPRTLNSNAALVYVEVPQHLYPEYPLRHIQIQGM